VIGEIVNILDVSKNTYWNWKKQNRPIIALLEKYFSKDDLIEFLNTGKISRLEPSVLLEEQKSINQELIRRLERLEACIKKDDKIKNNQDTKE